MCCIFSYVRADEEKEKRKMRRENLASFYIHVFESWLCTVLESILFLYRSKKLYIRGTNMLR